MSLDFVSEVWEALRSHIDPHERKEAADTLINLLIDNNYEADDIKAVSYTHLTLPTNREV